MPSDAELLRAYADGKSEPAFRELVARHLGLVYGVALRQCGGDAHLAADVTQRVFTALARKARALTGLPVLGGWLHRSTQFAASDTVRAERRRRAREQQASAMHDPTASAARDADWQKLAPVLDRAIGELTAADRDAIALRYFENRPFAEIGRALRLTEDAARMRVDRALDKLRHQLARRGITSTAAALGLVLAQSAGAAVPAGLLASVTSASLAGAAAGGGAGAVLSLFLMSKITSVVVGALLVAAVATVVVEGRAHRTLRTELAALQATVDTAPDVRDETHRLDLALQHLATTNPDADELARLRARVALLKSRPPGVTDEAMKSLAACRNVGRATPSAAIETGLWAVTSGDTDEMMRGYIFTADMKAALDAFFARQSEVVRARYGTPERLLGELWRAGHGTIPAAFEIAGEKRSYRSAVDRSDLRMWFRRADGVEMATTIRLERGPDGWGIYSGNYTAEHWAKLAARIDPVTGELHGPTK